MESNNNPRIEQQLSVMNLCRNYLFLTDIITAKESLTIKERIRAFAKENGAELTCAVASRAKIECEEYKFSLQE